MKTPNQSRMAIVIVALALVAGACGGGDDDDARSDPDPPPAEAASIDDAALQAILDQWRVDVDAYGATVSIRAPGHDDIHLAAGVDDRDPETPMRTNGTYGIGTLTRTFVAAAALQLVDEGLVALDEPVAPWLPELPNADRITLAMLLGFTSGLQQLDDGAERDLLLADLSRSFTPEEVLALHLAAPGGTPPGDQFAYGTDTGYVAAGLLIERVLDQDLATVIEDRFARPLALDDTIFSDGTVTPSRHQWFALDDNPERPLDTLDFPHEATATLNWASRNMLSSSPDLLDWGEALYTGQVLSADRTAAMLTLGNSFSPRWHYGLGAGGYCLEPTGCDPDDVDLVGHLGGFVGLDMMVAHHPHSGATLVMYANVTFGDDYVDNYLDLAGAVLDELGLA